MIVFKLDIGGNHLYLSSEDKPKLIDGYIHLEGGEHEGLSYKLRDDQLADYQGWLERVDRNTGLIDLNEGDRVAPFPAFEKYRRSQIAELRPYVDGEVLSDRISISAPDKEAGSPKLGDMIARNPANHDDQWLVAKAYFEANFEPA